MKIFGYIFIAMGICLQGIGFYKNDIQLRVDAFQFVLIGYLFTVWKR